jgi:hypothetical protein
VGLTLIDELNFEQLPLLKVAAPHFQFDYIGKGAFQHLSLLFATICG